MGFKPTLHACLVGAALVAGGGAVAQTKIDMIAFGGTSNLPIWVAQDRGFFAKHGVEIKLDRTPSSTQQFKDIMEGKYNVFSTAMDNIVAYQENMGSSQFGEQPDLFAFMGVHHGLNSLVVKPEIKTFQDIRGRTMGVDSMTTGYAFVLFKMLEKNGLIRERDYKVAAIGGGVERFNALKDGKIDGALMSAPNDVEAKELGFTILAEAADSLGGYQGSVYGARRGWAQKNERDLLAIARGIKEGHDYVFANKAGSIEVLRNRVKALSAEQAEVVYQGLVEGKGGLSRNGALSMDGIRTVLSLRSEMAGRKLDDPNKYIDQSVFQKIAK